MYANIETLGELVEEFCRNSHGNSNYDEDNYYVRGLSSGKFAPFSYLKKKLTDLTGPNDLLSSSSFIMVSFDFLEDNSFRDWYEAQFGKKLTSKMGREIFLLYRPNHKSIFDALEVVHRNYEILKNEKILINSKNLPTQLGEWYAKCIFGLNQVKSTSQRGFDFELEGKRVEVKVHWGDKSSPKGVKIRKSLVDLSDSCIIIYQTTNFMLREICFLDSEFVLRRFSGKGHTIFLKDNDIQSYFFSKSDKHFTKIIDKNALMTFASPYLALKLEGRL